jgi:putative hydrolase of the HAD superfamily
MQFPQKGVKNIIFDLGGVILDIDINLTIQAFNKLGSGDFQNQYSMSAQSDLFKDFEIGRISIESFIKTIGLTLPVNISRQEITKAWNAMILTIPEDRISLLQNLKTKYRTFLLSNTNPIHYQKYAGDLLQRGVKLEHLFHETWLSYKVGMRKPAAEIYLQLIAQEKIDPYETLMIDDLSENLTFPSILGMKVFHLQKGIELTSLFNSY